MFCFLTFNFPLQGTGLPGLFLSAVAYQTEMVRPCFPDERAGLSNAQTVLKERVKTKHREFNINKRLECLKKESD